MLDEPTDLPEGEIVELVPLRDILDDEERARLNESLESFEPIERGETIDGPQALAEIFAHR